MRLSKEEVNEYLSIDDEELRCAFALNNLCISCTDGNYTEFINSNTEKLYSVLETVNVSKTVYEKTVARYFTVDELNQFVS
ncbi:hypothetical protein [Paraclostridium bifermentans]|uniref:hypothetical protein n=1 Tax=Paraclostridium bifermentans TaxID=1490 RepID=UPI00374E7AD8